MINNNFKELFHFGKKLQVLNYKRVYSFKDLPKNNKKEFVFIGKSNVGKSSLINTILNYKINKVSRKPGCTKWIGFLELNEINIIDLPGYGYSSVAKGRQIFWEKMVNEYIDSQRYFKAFILIDSLKGIGEQDIEAYNAFSNSEFIYTKYDKFKSISEITSLKVSTINGNGIIELREILCS